MARPARDFRDEAQTRWPGASVISRHRKAIVHQHPTENRRMLDTSIGPLHINGTETEIDTAWLASDVQPYRRKMVLADYHAFAGLDDALNFDAGQIVRYVHPASGKGVAFQPQSLDWTNDLGQIQQISAPLAVAGAVADDTLTWTGAYGAGRDFVWQAQTTRLQKRLIIQSLGNLPAPNATILAGGNPVLRLSFIFQPDNGVDIYANGVLWDAKSSVGTSGDIEFRLAATGQTLWYFAHPYAHDQSNTNPPTVIQRIRKSGNSLIIEVRTPWSWLQSATYPVVIDPTVDEQVSATGYDGMEAASGTNTWWPDGFNTNGNFVGWNVGFEYDCDIGLIFTDVAIPTGATIDVAYVQLFAKSQASDYTNTPIIFSGFDEDDAAIFATDGTNRPSTRTKTTATVSQTIGTVTDEDWKTFNSIVSVIQEIVDRAGWAENNNIGLVIEENNAAENQRAAFQDYYNSSTQAGKLHVEYTAGGTNYTLTASAGTYGLTGTSASPLAGRKITADVGSYALTGVNAGLLHGRRITSDVGSYSLTGTDASLLRGFAIASLAGSYSYTGIDATLTYTPLGAYSLTADAGAYTLTGTQASLLVGRQLPALPGTFTVTGTDAGLLIARLLSANAGTYSLTGAAAGLSHGYNLSAVGGSYALTGTSASLLVARLIAMSAGAYAVNGTAASIVWSGEGLTHYTLTADAGTYSLTGTDAGLLIARLLSAGAGTYSLTGTDAGLLIARLLSANAGSYSLTGTAAGLSHGYNLTAVGGSYAVTGTSASLLVALLIVMSAGSYSINGIEISLDYSGAVEVTVPKSRFFMKYVLPHGKTDKYRAT